MNDQPDQATDGRSEAAVETTPPPGPQTEEERAQNNRVRLEKEYDARIITFNELETDSGFIDLANWLKMVSRYNMPEKHVMIFLPNDQDGIRIHLYTNDHKYSISARLPDSRPPRDEGYPEPIKNKGYLGCIVSARKARTGEYWNRGNDLKDGPYSFDTWIAIMGDIIGYELQKIKIDI